MDGVKELKTRIEASDRIVPAMIQFVTLLEMDTDVVEQVKFRGMSSTQWSCIDGRCDRFYKGKNDVERRKGGHNSRSKTSHAK
jgi:hypothetical protein